MKYYDKLIFELSKPGRSGYSLPENEFGKAAEMPESLARKSALGLPEVSEVDVVRHYTNLSQMNFGVDTGFYPLGSCTMKYNPKINEEQCRASSDFILFSRNLPYKVLSRFITTWRNPCPQ